MELLEGGIEGATKGPLLAAGPVRGVRRWHWCSSLADPAAATHPVFLSSSARRQQPTTRCSGRERGRGGPRARHGEAAWPTPPRMPAPCRTIWAPPPSAHFLGGLGSAVPPAPPPAARGDLCAWPTRVRAPCCGGHSSGRCPAAGPSPPSTCRPRRVATRCCVATRGGPPRGRPILSMMAAHWTRRTGRPRMVGRRRWEGGRKNRPPKWRRGGAVGMAQRGSRTPVSRARVWRRPNRPRGWRLPLARRWGRGAPAGCLPHWVEGREGVG